MTYAGLALLWISAVLTLYTGYDYFRAGGRHWCRETIGEGALFRWLRERVGVPEEEVEVPAEVRTVSELAAFLRAKGGGMPMPSTIRPWCAPPSTASM